jgi:hypothetical protein
MAVGTLKYHRLRASAAQMDPEPGKADSLTQDPAEAPRPGKRKRTINQCSGIPQLKFGTLA